MNLFIELNGLSEQSIYYLHSIIFHLTYKTARLWIIDVIPKSTLSIQITLFVNMLIRPEVNLQIIFSSHIISRSLPVIVFFGLFVPVFVFPPFFSITPLPVAMVVPPSPNPGSVIHLVPACRTPPHLHITCKIFNKSIKARTIYWSQISFLSFSTHPTGATGIQPRLLSVEVAIAVISFGWCLACPSILS